MKTISQERERSPGVPAENARLMGPAPELITDLAKVEKGKRLFLSPSTTGIRQLAVGGADCARPPRGTDVGWARGEAGQWEATQAAIPRKIRGLIQRVREISRRGVHTILAAARAKSVRAYANTKAECGHP